MPVIGGSYPHGPYRFIHREYLIISYEKAIPALIREGPARTAGAGGEPS